MPASEHSLSLFVRMCGRARASPACIVCAYLRPLFISLATTFSLIFPLCRNATLIKISEAGHFAFLDTLTLLQQSVCNLGKADPEAVRSACALSLLSFGNMVAASNQGVDSGCDDMSSRLSWMFAGLKHEVFSH